MNCTFLVSLYYRLQSTLEIDEKELYKMQRTNTGSLFPTSFYFGNRPDQSLTASPQVDVLDNGDELHESTEDVVHKREAQRERLKSRSYPESEFRNITRIIEENSQELNDEHSYLPQSPSESLSSSSVTYVEPEQRLLDTVFSSLETGGSDRGLLVNDGNRRRSHSEENLSGIASSFRDELATRLTFDRNPAVKSQGSSTAQNKAKSLREDEKSLPLVGDSSSDMQFFGDELATLLTIPEKKSNAPSVKESNDSQSKPIHGMISAYDSERLNNLIVDDELQKPTPRTKSSKDSSDLVKRAEDIKPFLTYGDEYSTTLILPEQPQKQQSLTPPAAETAYNKDQGVLQLSNSYKNVSGLLDSETTRETKVRYIDEPRDFPTSTSDISPVRPPRKKDKISKKSGKAKEIHFQKNNHDFYAGNKQAASLSDRFSESDLREIHRFDREDTKPDWTRDRLKNDQNRRQSLPTYVEYRGEENGLDFAPHDRQEKTSHSVHDRDPQPGGESNERHMSEEVNERRSGDWSRANPEYSRRKIDGYAKSQEVFVPQDVSPGYRRERLSNNFSTGTDALRSENRNKHVLPEVLLDATVRTTSLDHHEERKSSSRSSWSESAPDRLRQELRVPPPYRPPPYALTDPGSRQPNDFVLSPENSSNKTRLASRPNYPPPSIPPTLRPDYPPPNIPPNLRPNYTPPSIPPLARRSQRPDDYKPAFETSLDHPKRRLIKYSPDSYEPTSIPDYQTRNASLDERRSSPRQRHGERPVHLDVSSPAEALPPSNKNREGKVGNYYYPVDNSPFDGRNRDTTTRKSLETGNYDTSYNVTSSRNEPSGQSGLVQYEQEMATVLLPRREIRSEPGFVGSESSIRRGSDPGYVVAKLIPSNISCEVPAGHRGSKEDLNLISRYREEDTTSKSFPNSYDSQRTPELERRQKYRVTSMI